MTTTQTNQPNTRERLLQAASSLMWERSFQAAGVDDLCLRAGAKKGSFYHFFPSKSELAVAAIEHSWSYVRETIFEPVFNSDMSGLDQFRQLIKKVDQLQTNKADDAGCYLGCPFGSLGQEMAVQDELIRESLQKIFNQHYEYFEAALKRAQKDGQIPAGNNKQRAQKIFALLEGAMLLAKVANDPQLFRNIAPAINDIAAS